MCWGSKGHWPFPSRKGWLLPLDTSVKFSRCCGKGRKNLFLERKRSQNLQKSGCRSSTDCGGAPRAGKQKQEGWQDQELGFCRPNQTPQGQNGFGTKSAGPMVLCHGGGGHPASPLPSPGGTHDVGAGRAEGVGAADVEVGLVQGHQHPDEIEALGLHRGGKEQKRVTMTRVPASQFLPPPGSPRSVPHLPALFLESTLRGFLSRGAPRYLGRELRGSGAAMQAGSLATVSQPEQGN